MNYVFVRDLISFSALYIRRQLNYYCTELYFGLLVTTVFIRLNRIDFMLDSLLVRCRRRDINITTGVFLFMQVQLLMAEVRVFTIVLCGALH